MGIQQRSFGLRGVASRWPSLSLSFSPSGGRVACSNVFHGKLKPITGYSTDRENTRVMSHLQFADDNLLMGLRVGLMSNI